MKVSLARRRHRRPSPVRGPVPERGIPLRDHPLPVRSADRPGPAAHAAGAVGES